MILFVEETHQRCGKFKAWCDEFGVVCKSSRQPFLDGARALLAKGADPDALLVMCHAKTGTDSLCGKIGAAAKLTIEDSQMKSPRFRRWQPDDRFSE